MIKVLVVRMALQLNRKDLKIGNCPRTTIVCPGILFVEGHIIAMLSRPSIKSLGILIHASLQDSPIQLDSWLRWYCVSLQKGEFIFSFHSFYWLWALGFTKANYNLSCLHIDVLCGMKQMHQWNLVSLYCLIVIYPTEPSATLASRTLFLLLALVTTISLAW